MAALWSIHWGFLKVRPGQDCIGGWWVGGISGGQARNGKGLEAWYVSMAFLGQGEVEYSEFKFLSEKAGLSGVL